MRHSIHIFKYLSVFITNTAIVDRHSGLVISDYRGKINYFDCYAAKSICHKKTQHVKHALWSRVIVFHSFGKIV